ncbi:hypothetical protein VTL71DRAFT_14212 [Oculimacula yallundae]|uniref:Uncharacterized protein n=1 Tax=Oculimacula yallundae TaxID=86028 RepID=A0ABR4CJY5_9HELO
MSPNDPNDHKKIWLITGCSSGFGFSLALHVLKSSHLVIATSRNPSKTPDLVSQIEELGGKWMQLDVTCGEEEMKAFVERAENVYEEGRGIDVVVNNAGIAYLGAFECFSAAETHTQMATNFFGPLSLLRHLIPHFRSRRSGTIVNMSSTAGIEARPSRSLYAASKFALEAVSEALYDELKPLGIKVLLVEPGAFRTKFVDNVVLPEKAMPADYEGSEMHQVLNGVMAMSSNGGMGTFEGKLGDVGKGVKAIFDAVEGTGWAEGMQPFLRLPLGRDNAERWEGKLRSLRENLDGTEAIWSKTGED